MDGEGMMEEAQEQEEKAQKGSGKVENGQVLQECTEVWFTGDQKTSN